MLKKELSPKTRNLMVFEVLQQHQKLAVVAKKYGISRVTLYKWIKRYKEESASSEAQLVNKERVIETYWRQTPGNYEQAILSLVAKHPEWGIRTLVRNLPRIGNSPIVGHHGVQNVLRRNTLSTYQQRAAYVESLRTPAIRTIESIVQKATDFVQLPASTRTSTVRTATTFFLSMFATVAIFGSGAYMFSGAGSYSGWDRVGLGFALTALTAGMFFFLYSLKYYLTLAVVLSFSQKESSSNPSFSNNKKGLLGMLMGSASEGFDESVGLNADLSSVKLKEHPFVSVQIPYFNEKNVVDRSIHAAVSFDYPAYEVILCDDSNDQTTEIIRSRMKRYLFEGEKLKETKGEGWVLTEVEVRPGVSLKHLHRINREGFKGAALDLALKLSDPRTEKVAIFDADFVPYPDTLKLFLKYFQLKDDDKAAAVQGYQWHVLNKSENWITRGVRTEYSGSYVIERSGAEIYGGLKQISGSVYMIKKEVLEQIGWGTSITEDFELTLRLYEAGYKVIYTPYIQAPAECASTLKRLIRQRMRWAEGHSFNVKKMFLPLLKSPNLTLIEKFEFAYLSPYYLQALFFLIGTFCWLMAETVFRVTLPFWTELWGWSLILTNMIALPLMNSVGMFLEESEERDYLGLTSFVALSYILVPFQAYAAVKGFIEKEEGTWFRTPKSGRITDTFSRSKFVRFIQGIIPAKLEDHSESPYLAINTAHSYFNRFNIGKAKNRAWISKSFLTVLLLLTTSLVNYAPYIDTFESTPKELPSSGRIIGWNGSLVGEVNASESNSQANTFKVSETPEIIIEDDRPLSYKLFEKISNTFNKQKTSFIDNLKISLIDPAGEMITQGIEVKAQGDNAVVTVNRGETPQPGNYKLTSEISGQKTITDFSWGVLVINSNKSLYSPGETAYLQMATLDSTGHTVCDSNLELVINGGDVLSTKNGKIKKSESCGKDNVTDEPDYYAYYKTSKVGDYHLALKNIDTKTVIEDSLRVVENIVFDVEREGATRINPFKSNYTMNFEITPKADFKGVVTEELPTKFEVVGSKNSWLVDWKAGKKYELEYTYKAPEISPEVFVLGPLKFIDQNDNVVFTESRHWQIASDALDPVVGLYTPPNTWTTVGDANISLPQPDPRNGDLMLATIAIRPSTVTLATPTGWSLVDTRTGTDGAGEGADTGSVRTYWFSKTADGTEGTSTQTFTKTGTASVIIGAITQLRSGTGTYSISAGGYSLNGDTTTWGSTLDNDIGLTRGDIVILAAAQNGDLANTSAWNIAATNINTKSVAIEHSEYGSTTGNGVEVGFASTIIHDGTNIATPTTTITQSAAASGTVVAIRIRQGAGTQRSDTWVRSAGRPTIGSTSISVNYPEHSLGDLLVLVITSRATTAPTPTTPAGWTQLVTNSAGSGAFGADAGPARMTILYKVAEAYPVSATGTLTVAITSGDTSIGQMLAIHRDNAGSWNVDGDSGSDTSGGTGWSAAGSGVDLSSSNGGDVLLVASAVNTDAYTYSGYGISASGITFNDIVDTNQFATVQGNDSSLVVATSRVTSGSGSNAPTFTMTASGSTANAPTGVSAFMKINATDATEPSSTVGLMMSDFDAVAGADASIAIPQQSPQNGDLLLVNVAIRPSSSTVSTPAGWTLLDNRTGTDGAAEGVDTGSVGLYTFYKVADGTEGATSVTFAETGTTSVILGKLTKFRSATGTYSLSAGGYSLNADTTTWGSTLDSNIGMQQGDVVLMAAAQNGDLGITSAWDIESSGVTLKSTMTEQTEYSSSNGNDVKMPIATGIVWEGTGSTTPTTILTLGTAASGTVVAVRVRQGSGTPRSDTWVRSSDAGVMGITSLLMTYPIHDIGDVMVLTVGSRGTSDPTVTTPAGWTSLGTYNGGSGSFAVDAGNSRITSFYREVDYRLFSDFTVNITSADSSIGIINVIHKEDIDSWTFDVDGGTDTTAGTGWSVTGSGIDLSSSSGGDLVIAASSINTDARTYSAHALSASGITFGSVAQYLLRITGNGNDAAMDIATGRVTVGSATNVAPTFSMTASGTATNSPAGSTIFIKISGSGATPSTATAYSFQRKTWNDGTRDWMSYHNGNEIVFYYSVDAGDNWTINSSATISTPTNDFSIWADATTAFIVYTNGFDILAREAGSYPGTGFSWGSANTALDGSSPTVNYQYPTITKDSNNKIWVLATLRSSSTYDTYVRQATNADDIATWNASESLDTSANNNRYGVIVPRTSGSVFAIWIDGTAIESENYNGSAWDGSSTSVATGVTGLTTTHSLVSDSSGNVHALYIDSSNNTVYRQFTSSWQTAVVLDSNSGNAYPSISIDTANGDLYALWIRGNHIYYKKGVAGYASGNWDVSATDWVATGTNTYVTSNYSGSGKIFAEWTSGTANPYTVNWDIVVVPEFVWLFFIAGPLIPILRKYKAYKDARK